MITNRLCLFESRDSEEETIPDEDYSLISKEKTTLNSWHVGESNYPKLSDGPNINLKYLVGTMIEVPRAALLADKVASSAEFFSFGTNDLTQLTYGFSRDDASKFLNDYYDKEILTKDPFKTIDEEGVGRLLYIAINKGHKVRPNMEMGICGEHGGEEASINLCHNLGLDYVSCSPYRVPIAKLAAAQASIKAKKNK